MPAYTFLQVSVLTMENTAFCLWGAVCHQLNSVEPEGLHSWAHSELPPGTSGCGMLPCAFLVNCCSCSLEPLNCLGSHVGGLCLSFVLFLLRKSQYSHFLWVLILVMETTELFHMWQKHSSLASHAFMYLPLQSRGTSSPIWCPATCIEVIHPLWLPC